MRKILLAAALVAAFAGTYAHARGKTGWICIQYGGGTQCFPTIE